MILTACQLVLGYFMPTGQRIREKGMNPVHLSPAMCK